jgi:hypothetical protein
MALAAKGDDESGEGSDPETDGSLEYNAPIDAELLRAFGADEEETS